MRKIITFILGTLLSLSLLLLSGFLIWIFFREFYEVLKASNPSIAAAIIGAMATTLVGIGGVLLTQSRTTRRQIEESHRPRKVQIYEKFLEMTSRMMTGQNENVSNREPNEKELADFFVTYKTDIILWASPKVIDAQLAFESASLEGKNVLFAADTLFLAIRDDLGLSNRGLNSHQLIKMYLKNPEELDEQKHLTTQSR